MVRVMTTEEAFRYLFMLAGNTSDRVKVEGVDGHLKASVRLADSWTQYATVEWVEKPIR